MPICEDDKTGIVTRGPMSSTLYNVKDAPREQLIRLGLEDDAPPL